MDAHHQQADGPVPSQLRLFPGFWPHENESQDACGAGGDLQDRIAIRWRQQGNPGDALGDHRSFDPIHGRPVTQRDMDRNWNCNEICDMELFGRAPQETSEASYSRRRHYRHSRMLKTRYRANQPLGGMVFLVAWEASNQGTRRSGEKALGYS